MPVCLPDQLPLDQFRKLQGESVCNKEKMIITISNKETNKQKI